MAENNIQVWLSYNNNAERLRLPVNPSSIRVSTSHGYEDIEVTALGSYTLIGERKAMEFSFSSFFPRDYNPSYCEYEDIPSPFSEAVNIIIRWMRTRKPIRLIVTGTNINYAVTVRDFTYEERGGSPGDVYFDIALREYNFITVKQVDTTAPNKATVKTVASSRPNTSTPPKSYTVKSGDTLWKIAQKTLGNGDKWRTIYDKNKTVIGKNPNTIKVGQVLVMP